MVFIIGLTFAVVLAIVLGLYWAFVLRLEQSDDAALRRAHGDAALRHVRARFDAPVLAQREAAIYCQALGVRAAVVWPEGACGATMTA